MSARKTIYAALKFYREIRKDAKQLRTQPCVIKILSNFLPRNTIFVPPQTIYNTHKLDG